MNSAPHTNYKGIAREKLLGRYSTIIGAILIMQLILFGVSYITDRVVDGSTTIGILIYLAIAVITGLISAVFTVGELTMYMRLVGGEPISIWNIFSGFTGQPDKAIILQFKIAVRCFLLLIPAGVIFAVLYAMGGVSIVNGGDISMGPNANDPVCRILIIMCIAAIILGIIGCIYVRMRYAQVFYMLIDHPEYSSGEIMGKSSELMKGHMRTYLYINLSFIPIMLLGILSMGVGLMYIQPYRGVTLTEFYMALVSGELNRGRNIDVVIDDKESIMG